jgi:peptidyl-prolyl cis-trans isomerase C
MNQNIIKITLFAILGLIAQASQPLWANTEATSTKQSKVITSSADQAKIDLLVKDAVNRGAQDTPALRNLIQKDLDRKGVLLQEARKLGLDKQANVRLRSEMAAQDVIIQSFLADWRKANPITDDMIKAEYATYQSSMADKEYTFKEIIVRTEEDAKGIMARLKTGESFESIASNSSLNARARSKDGLVDWTNSGLLDKDLATTLAKLTKGQLAPSAVKTGQIWRIVKLEGSRPFVLPTLEALKPQIIRKINEKSTAEYIDGLVKKSKR